MLKKTMIFIFLIVILCGFKYKDTINIYENNSQYYINISYYETNKKKIDKEINKFIQDNINMFKKRTLEDNNKIKYELTSKIDVKKYGRLSFYKIILDTYLGGNHNYPIYYQITYDEQGNIYKISDFIQDINLIKPLIKEKIILYLQDNNDYFDEKWIEDGTNNSEYNLYDLDSEGINIYFKPYEVAPWATGEIKIHIKYSEFDKSII